MFLSPLQGIRCNELDCRAHKQVDDHKQEEFIARILERARILCHKGKSECSIGHDNVHDLEDIELHDGDLSDTRPPRVLLKLRNEQATNRPPDSVYKDDHDSDQDRYPDVVLGVLLGASLLHKVDNYRRNHQKRDENEPGNGRAEEPVALRVLLAVLRDLVVLPVQPENVVRAAVGPVACTHHNKIHKRQHKPHNNRGYREDVPHHLLVGTIGRNKELLVESEVPDRLNVSVPPGNELQERVVAPYGVLDVHAGVVAHNRLGGIPTRDKTQKVYKADCKENNVGYDDELHKGEVDAVPYPVTLLNLIKGDEKRHLETLVLILNLLNIGARVGGTVVGAVEVVHVNFVVRCCPVICHLSIIFFFLLFLFVFCVSVFPFFSFSLFLSFFLVIIKFC